MPSAPAPLDRARFAALWRRLGGLGSADPVFDALAAAWTEPGRAYHDATHLAACLAALHQARDEARRADEVEAALWFHDAVYDSRAADNEARSAEWAARALTEAGAPDGVAARVAALVLVTRHDAMPADADADARLIADLDLAILGASAEEFDRYERAIRAEYAWVPEPVYRRERSRVLEGFLKRDPLYLTASFRELESRARDNVRRALARLRP